MSEDKNLKINFSLFISSLLMEGLMALGATENPITKKTETNLEHASQVIDALDMLKEKTKGNLTAEEGTGLDQALHQMRMLYISKKEEKKA